LTVGAAAGDSGHAAAELVGTKFACGASVVFLGLLFAVGAAGLLRSLQMMSSDQESSVN
jgi:hypothetical protein